MQNTQPSQDILIQINNLSVHTKDGATLVEPISLSIKKGAKFDHLR